MKAALISLGSVSSQMTSKAMKKYFDEVDDIDLRHVEVILSAKGMEVLYKGKPIKEDYDCIYAKGSFRYAILLRAITTAMQDKSYMPIKPKSFTLGHDKLLTHFKLQEGKIPMPKTYVSPTPSAAKELLEKINYPVIMKFPQGTQGKGVMYADSFAAASSILDALTALNQPFLIQEYVETSGMDIRAIVVGGKVAASMRRKAIEGEKRANIHAGATGEPVELDNYTKKVAVRSAEILGSEICAVDILESVKGPMVIELNLSPGLQGITEVTKIDIADKIASFLYSQAVKFKEERKKETKNEVFNELGISEAGCKEILTNLDFRANRILLPDLITQIAKLNETNEVSIKAKEGKISIERLGNGKTNNSK